MKTLFIHNTIPEYRVDFMRKLSQLGEITYLITDINRAKQIYEIELNENLEGINYILAPYKKFASFLKKQVENEGYSNVILPSVDNFFQYYWGILALQCASKFHLKAIYWSEKWEAEPSLQPIKKKVKNAVQRLMIKSLAKRCDICVAAGSKAKDYYLSLGIDNKKIAIAFDSSTSPDLENHVNLKEKIGIKPSCKVVLYLGRLVERKGCDLLIKAFGKIAEKRNDVWLLIGGKGDEKFEAKCRKLANEIAPFRICFLGLIKPEIRRAYYQMADVFVLSSYSLGGVIEAWGLTVNEALECGTPVIATTAVGSAYDLLNGKNGLMVQENNIEQIVYGIEKFLNADKTAFANACVKTANCFSVQKMAEEFSKIIQI